MIWSRHPIETLQPFFWLIRGYPMGTHWFWDPISSPKKTRPKFLLRFWGLSKSEETPAFLPFTSCNATAKMRDSTWDSAASQCRRVYFETDLKFPMPNFHFHSELYNWKGSWEDKHTISYEHSALKPPSTVCSQLSPFNTTAVLPLELDLVRGLRSRSKPIDCHLTSEEEKRKTMGI